MASLFYRLISYPLAWLLLDTFQAIYAGSGHRSSPEFRSKSVTFNVPGMQNTAESSIEGVCSYSVSISLTHQFVDAYHDSEKIMLYTILVVVIFALTALAFFIYDFIVQRRNSLVLQTAAKFNTIVSSLFPSNIRGRLFADKEKDYMEYTTAKSHLKNFLTKGDIDVDGDEDEDGDGLILKTKPMADLFTDTTIMFADVCFSPFVNRSLQHFSSNFVPLFLDICIRLLVLQLGVVCVSLLRYSSFSRQSTDPSTSKFLQDHK